jgi:hypothetical protein
MLNAGENPRKTDKRGVPGGGRREMHEEGVALVLVMCNYFPLFGASFLNRKTMLSSNCSSQQRPRGLNVM